MGDGGVQDPAAGDPAAGDGAPSLQATPFVEVEIPIHIESALNLREGHWAKRHRRAIVHDEAVTYSLRSEAFRALVAEGGPYVVTITRLAPRRLDDDNAIGGAKHIRDSVARLLGIDDGDPRITWRYQQERRKTFAARVRVEVERAE